MGSSICFVLRTKVCHVLVQRMRILRQAHHLRQEQQQPQWAPRHRCRVFISSVPLEPESEKVRRGFLQLCACLPRKRAKTVKPPFAFSGKTGPRLARKHHSPVIVPAQVLPHVMCNLLQRAISYSKRNTSLSKAFPLLWNKRSASLSLVARDLRLRGEQAPDIPRPCPSPP